MRKSLWELIGSDTSATPSPTEVYARAGLILHNEMIEKKARKLIASLDESGDLTHEEILQKLLKLPIPDDC